MGAIFGETLTFNQDDAAHIELVVFGDEFYARYETVDGYTVVYDADLGQYCYAFLLGGRFVSSRAATAKPPPPGLRRHLRETKDARNATFDARFSSALPPEPVDDPLIMRAFAANQGLLPGRRVADGQVRGLTVLVEFADRDAGVTADDVDALLNAENYAVNGASCSVREYFLRVSNGALDYGNRVVGPVKLSKNRSHYKERLLVREALDIVVHELGIDLSEFDSRGEGVVDALNFMYAGRTAYEGKLWPHNSHINLNYGGIQTSMYMLTSLGRHSVDLTIGTFCHENGHQLCRFPDMYDYGLRDGDFEDSQGIGRYCLMGSGNHLNRGRSPSPVCAYLRHLVGWADTEILVHGEGEYSARHGDYGSVIKYETDRDNEYFLVENRTQIGLDTHLPDGGLAVYHCDTLGSNEWQEGARDRHYQCALIQADGHLDLESNRNTGDSGDLFPETARVALSHDTTPSSRQWDGAESGLTLSDVGPPGAAIPFRIGVPAAAPSVTGRQSPDALIPDNDPEGAVSRIAIAQAGVARSVKVVVDITHTYTGDLQVRLEAPSGAAATLHDREGRSRDDLRRTYSADTTDAMATLAGQSIQGPWTLHVRDLARRDTGRLNEWSIEIGYEPTDESIEIEHEPKLTIPDDDADGALNAITIPDDAVAKAVGVSVHIVHPHIGDLVVALIAPSGRRAVLHDRAGAGKRNLYASYDASTTPALSALVGEPTRGDWTLHIQDLAAPDAGKLEQWWLRLTH